MICIPLPLFDRPDMKTSFAMAVPVCHNPDHRGPHWTAHEMEKDNGKNRLMKMSVKKSIGKGRCPIKRNGHVFVNGQIVRKVINNFNTQTT